MAVALAPIAFYVAIMVATFALNPSHFPGAMFAPGGGIVAMGSVGIANALKIFRDRKKAGSA